MGQKIAIIGSGPAGCMTACNLDKSFEITLFDKSKPLKTLLPTGGGRCNLAHAEYNFKDLAKIILEVKNSCILFFLNLEHKTH